MPRKEQRIILGLDQGSSSTKAVLCTESGEVLERYRRPVQTFAFDTSCVEQDPAELFQSVDDIVKEVSEKNDIAAIGFSLQRSGVSAWDRDSGEVLHRLISWRDTRFTDVVEQMPESDRDLVGTLAGLPVLPDYAATKIAHLQREFPEESVLIGTLDSYLHHRISGGEVFAVDDSMAARTMLYDISDAKWGEELCGVFGVDTKRLPILRPSLGKICDYRGAPLLASLGDKQASMLIDAPKPGMISINIGSMTSIAVHTDEVVVERGYLSSILFSEEVAGKQSHHSMLEGVFNSSGATLDYLKNRYGEEKFFERLDSAYAEVRQADVPLAFLPFKSTGTPEWRRDIPFLICSEQEVVEKHCLSSFLEYIGFGIALVLERSVKLLADKVDSSDVVVSGGLSQLSPLVQIIADCSGKTLVISASSESSAYGAALAATRVLTSNSDLIWCSRGRVVQPSGNQNLLERYNEWKQLRKRLIAGEEIGIGYQELTV